MSTARTEYLPPRSGARAGQPSQVAKLDESSAMSARSATDEAIFTIAMRRSRKKSQRWPIRNAVKAMNTQPFISAAPQAHRRRVGPPPRPIRSQDEPGHRNPLPDALELCL